MYAKQPKKMLVMNILEILRRYSDKNHTLSQKDIIDYLKSEYDMSADRKAVKRNLTDLSDSGYKLRSSDFERKNKDGEIETICREWYLERDFTDAELRLVIDSLLFSKHIPYTQCKELIKKIEGLASVHFESKMRHVSNLPTNNPKNDDIIQTIATIDEAIEKGMQVSFHYADYGTDKKLHLRKNDYGNPREYLVSPYQMVATNGRYYLIGNIAHHDNVFHCRVDRIRDIHVTKIAAKQQREVKGLEKGLDLPKHMAEHVYMYSGESVRVVMRATRGMVGEFIDWFGTDVTFWNESETSVMASVVANEKAMRYWILQHAPYVTVLSPQSLVDEVKNDLKNSLSNYTEPDHE